MEGALLLTSNSYVQFLFTNAFKYMYRVYLEVTKQPL